MSGIYLSYRRMESAAYAGRLFDNLSRHFGRGSVFMDIGGITRGQEFSRAIESALNACQVVLVVIGNGWASYTGQDGRRRLDDPNDWVRIEVVAALRRNVLVVPVLVEGARLPDPASLPEELRPLCQRHACELSDLRWSYDVGELVRDLEKVVRLPKRFKVPDVKGKRLRWFAGGAIILALLLGIAFYVPTVFRKIPQGTPKQPKLMESPASTVAVPQPATKAQLADTAEKVKRAPRPTRSVTVLTPTIAMPAMKQIVVVPEGDADNPFATIGITAVGAATKYDEPIRIPPDVKAEKFDVVWIPQNGRRIVLVKSIGFDEQNVAQSIKPEEHIGLVRLDGKDLPKPTRIYVALAGENRQTVKLINIQEAEKYGEDMPVPPGTYDLYVDVASENRLELVVEKFDVKAGAVTEIE